MIVDTFNTVCISFNWSRIQPSPDQFLWESVDGQIEWCMDHNLSMCCGPLFRMEQALLPAWFRDLSEIDQMRRAVISFVEQVNERYGSRVDLFHCVAGINSRSDFALSSEQQIRLSVDAIETMGAASHNTPFIASFAQPWCEDSANSQIRIPPLHCADTLLRAELGLTGFGLEINYGYQPGGTAPRNILQINEMIDTWSQLGLPLVVELTAPAGSSPDPMATFETAVVDEVQSGDHYRFIFEEVVPLLLAKPSVHAIIWNQLDDRVPHRFPNGGLFDINGAPRPILDKLKALRQSHLR